jgi:hypothetical protein
MQTLTLNPLGLSPAEFAAAALAVTARRAAAPVTSTAAASAAAATAMAAATVFYLSLALIFSEDAVAAASARTPPLTAPAQQQPSLAHARVTAVLRTVAAAADVALVDAARETMLLTRAAVTVDAAHTDAGAGKSGFYADVAPVKAASAAATSALVKGFNRSLMDSINAAAAATAEASRTAAAKAIAAGALEAMTLADLAFPTATCSAAVDGSRAGEGLQIAAYEVADALARAPGLHTLSAAAATAAAALMAPSTASVASSALAAAADTAAGTSRLFHALISDSFAAAMLSLCLTSATIQVQDENAPDARVQAAVSALAAAAAGACAHVFVLELLDAAAAVPASAESTSPAVTAAIAAAAALRTYWWPLPSVCASVSGLRVTYTAAFGARALSPLVPDAAYANMVAGAIVMPALSGVACLGKAWQSAVGAAAAARVRTAAAAAAAANAAPAPGSGALVVSVSGLWRAALEQTERDCERAWGCDLRVANFSNTALMGLQDVLKAASAAATAAVTAAAASAPCERACAHAAAGAVFVLAHTIASIDVFSSHAPKDPSTDVVSNGVARMLAALSLTPGAVAAAATAVAAAARGTAYGATAASVAANAGQLLTLALTQQDDPNASANSGDNDVQAALRAWLLALTPESTAPELAAMTAAAASAASALTVTPASAPASAASAATSVRAAQAATAALLAPPELLPVSVYSRTLATHRSAAFGDGASAAAGAGASHAGVSASQAPTATAAAVRGGRASTVSVPSASVIAGAGVAARGRQSLPSGAGGVTGTDDDGSGALLPGLSFGSAGQLSSVSLPSSAVTATVAVGTGRGVKREGSRSGAGGAGAAAAAAAAAGAESVAQQISSSLQSARATATSLIAGNDTATNMLAAWGFTFD